MKNTLICVLVVLTLASCKKLDYSLLQSADISRVIVGKWRATQTISSYYVNGMLAHNDTLVNPVKTYQFTGANTEVTNVNGNLSNGLYTLLNSNTVLHLQTSSDFEDYFILFPDDDTLNLTSTKQSVTYLTGEETHNADFVVIKSHFIRQQ